MKNFHKYNIFFRYVINAYLVILIVKTINYKDIDKFYLWIA